MEKNRFIGVFLIVIGIVVWLTDVDVDAGVTEKQMPENYITFFYEDNLHYSKKYKNTSIITDNGADAEKVSKLLSVKDFPTIELVVYLDGGKYGYEDCKGSTDGDGTIFITYCDGIGTRGWYLNETNWLDFVLYHEIGHNELDNTARTYKEQCDADEFAYQFTKDVVERNASVCEELKDEEYNGDEIVYRN